MGLNSKVPFSTRDNADHPVSLYAATKKADELMAHTYSHLIRNKGNRVCVSFTFMALGKAGYAYFKFVKAPWKGNLLRCV